ncbi:MAG: MFS transporter [Gemmataceae bacterium]|nr:MFS transporter [Gemmataceae bacterium]
MHFRLSLLMFLIFSIMGAWVPVLSPFLSQLGFTPRESAWIFASSALGAICGPVVWGQVADRWLAAEKCVSLCCLVSGVSLWLAAASARPLTVFWSCLAFWMFMIPAMSVSASLTFRHLANPDKEYGRVRVWGTIGWVAIGWGLHEWFRLRSADITGLLDWADALRLGAGCAGLTAVYAWTLPHTPPLPRTERAAVAANWLTTALEAPLAALHLFRDRSFAVLCASLFVVYLLFTFTAQLTPLLLRRHAGVTDAWLPSVLTLAQSTEIATLASLPILLVRLGQKGTMVVGLTAWILALTVFSVGAPRSLVIGSLALHGIFISCFVVAGQLYVNRLARADLRASAQGLMQLINGLGLLTGHFLVGWLRDRVGEDYPRAFVPGAVLGGLLLIVFSVGFRGTRR